MEWEHVPNLILVYAIMDGLVLLVQHHAALESWLIHHQFVVVLELVHNLIPVCATQIGKVLNAPYPCALDNWQTLLQFAMVSVPALNQTLVYAIMDGLEPCALLLAALGN